MNSMLALSDMLMRAVVPVPCASRNSPPKRAREFPVMFISNSFPNTEDSAMYAAPASWKNASFDRSMVAFRPPAIEPGWYVVLRFATRREPPVMMSPLLPV